MHFSPCFEASSRCLPSPDGMLIATLRNDCSVVLRDTQTLEIVNIVQPAPSDSFTPQTNLAWSPSSTRLLLSGADKVRVYDVLDGLLYASINNISHSGKEPTCVQFGAHDNEIFIFSAFGLKFSVFDLRTSKAVQIANPRFHHSSTVSKGFSISPSDAHLALLTRTAGRDAVSIHHPQTRELLKSWQPQVMSASGVVWTPNARWLIIWDSPASGHSLLVYTPDGQLFRELDASRLGLEAASSGQPGIKHCQLNAAGTRCAIGDHSRIVKIVTAADLWRLESSLHHPTSITPKDTLQIWQEQIIGDGLDGHPSHHFIRASQIASPSFEDRSAADLRVGCSSAAFDVSGSLLASRLDDSPSTLWIWDTAAAELRAVLMFHSSVTFSWHPRIHELMLVTLQDDSHRCLSYVWDPLSEGPHALQLAQQLPSGKGSGKFQASWISSTDEIPRLFLSDQEHFVLVAVTETGPYPPQWPSSHDNRDRLSFSGYEGEDNSTLDDTFSFKKA